MITAAQLRAARAMLDMDQRKLAKLSDLSLPTIQRMEASEGVIRGNVDSLMKLVAARSMPAELNSFPTMPRVPAEAAASDLRDHQRNHRIPMRNEYARFNPEIPVGHLCGES
jgi:hypothetical protein